MTAHRLLAARPRPGAAVDAAIAATALGVTLLLLSHGGITRVPHGSELDARGAILAACQTLPLLAWRRAPFVVFATTVLASTAAAGFGYAPGLPIGATAALYLLASSRSDSEPWTARATAATVAAFAMYMAATAAAGREVIGVEFFHALLAWHVAWFAGERTRLRRVQLAALQERVARAARDADLDRQLAVAEERARIARDLHDSAGHAINVIAVRAGAARLRREAGAEDSGATLAAIEELARETAGEIDRFVGALREVPTDAVDPPPGLASLGTLIAHHAAAGLAVTLDTAGTPRPLGPGLDQGVYRILQEALTNAARHGTGTASVDFAYRDTTVTLGVENPVLADTAERLTGGHGVIGMKERATLLGGSLTTQRINGYFRVDAELPDGAVHP